VVEASLSVIPARKCVKGMQERTTIRHALSTMRRCASQSQRGAVMCHTMTSHAHRRHAASPMPAPHKEHRGAGTVATSPTAAPGRLHQQGCRRQEKCHSAALDWVRTTVSLCKLQSQRENQGECTHSENQSRMRLPAAPHRPCLHSLPGWLGPGSTLVPCNQCNPLLQEPMPKQSCMPLLRIWVLCQLHAATHTSLQE
jgi:hypothetical protein